MTIRRLARMPRLPSGTRFVAQTIRLTDTENKRLKRAAKKEQATFNAWAVNVLNEAADRVLIKPTSPESETITNGTTTSEQAAEQL